MHLILLSGGSGKRLWPLSNEVRSKQFLKLFTNDLGEKESMVQRVYRQTREAGIEAPVVVTTCISQVDALRGQLGTEVETVLEPSRRDTFPAIALSACYLAKEKRCPSEEVVIVLPVDPFTEISYFKTLQKMADVIVKGKANIALMGIQPTYPSEKYGYIIPEGSSEKVARFQEKPDLATAEKLLEENAFWNGGVFAFRLGYLMDILSKYGEFHSYQDLYEKYDTLPKISFDYEIVEQEKSIQMVPFDGMWKDLGTWNTLSEEIRSDQGLVMKGEETENTQIINELSIPVVALGCKHMVIAASPDGILISDKVKSSYMKPYVESFENRPMYEEKGWGTYRVLDYHKHENGLKSLTKELFIKESHHISYQKHNFRKEVWTITSGKALFVLDEIITILADGDVVKVGEGQRHSIHALTPCTIIEVQIGTELIEEDIERFPYDWKL